MLSSALPATSAALAGGLLAASLPVVCQPVVCQPEAERASLPGAGPESASIRRTLKLRPSEPGHHPPRPSTTADWQYYFGSRVFAEAVLQVTAQSPHMNSE